ncbi:tetranectin-like [Heptranchias perlo]|uniref:tetranectin-like n=1 Tax=Heptranchias perlo TaxID=212740 RepID=UPI00355AC6B2
MELRGICFVLSVLCLLQMTHQQVDKPKAKKNAPPKKVVVTASMIEDIKKQIDHILEEVNLLKEKQALQSVCLRGMKVRSKCFLSMSGEKKFHEAADDCIMHGGILGTASNDEENDALYDYARTAVGHDRDIWIGVSDIVAEGSWVDVTGAAVNYTNWETEITLQPDGGTKENCVVLSGPANGKWFDQPCRFKKNYFCEFIIS